jgi:hypothetical protein
MKAETAFHPPLHYVTLITLSILKSTIRSFDFDVVLGMKLPTSSPLNFIEDLFAEVYSPLPLFPLRGSGLMILS